VAGFQAARSGPLADAPPAPSTAPLEDG
jgi:hypothetical protein